MPTFRLILFLYSIGFIIFCLKMIVWVLKTLLFLLFFMFAAPNIGDIKTLANIFIILSLLLHFFFFFFFFLVGLF